MAASGVGSDSPAGEDRGCIDLARRNESAPGPFESWGAKFFQPSPNAPCTGNFLIALHFVKVIGLGRIFQSESTNQLRLCWCRCSAIVRPHTAPNAPTIGYTKGTGSKSTGAGSWAHSSVSKAFHSGHRYKTSGRPCQAASRRVGHRMRGPDNRGSSLDRARDPGLGSEHRFRATGRSTIPARTCGWAADLNLQ